MHIIALLVLTSAAPEAHQDATLAASNQTAAHPISPHPGVWIDGSKLIENHVVALLNQTAIFSALFLFISFVYFLCTSVFHSL